MMERFIILVMIGLLSVHHITAPPVKEHKEEIENDENKIDANPQEDLSDYMEYSRYLKEVVNALESDPEFRQKLEKAEEADIRTGKIAHELEYVSHRVRSRLDEIKRAELERLRHLASKKHDLENGIDTEHLKISPVNDVDKEHLDHANPHTFEIEDLKKLIAKTSQDLAEADRKRREEFKQYELQKEFEKQQKLKSLDDAQRIEMEKQFTEQETKHKKHEPLHHPGSKKQLEEVWEKQDHMDSQEFDPKTFFMLHDLDGNGVWDENEVKALFLKELDKLYQSGMPEDDMRERAEEMERMREHVFSEADTNRDRLISFQEFLDQTRRPDFNQDPGWETLDQQQMYTHEEYQEFERRRMQEIERLIAQGMLQPHPGMPHPQYPPHAGQFPPHQGQMPPPGYNQQHPPPNYHPNAVPQNHPGQPIVPPHPQAQAYHGQIPPAQMNRGQAHPGQLNPNEAYQGQMNYGQMHPGQMNPGQGHPGQMNPGQGHPGQMNPGQGHPGQMNPGQGHPSQMNSGQIHSSQMNPGQGHPAQMNPGQGHPEQASQGHPDTGNKNEIQKQQVQETNQKPHQDDARQQKDKPAEQPPAAGSQSQKPT